MLLRCDVAEKFLSPCWKAMIQAKRRVKAKKIHQDLGQSEVKGQLLAVSWNGPNNSITEGYEPHLRNLSLSPARFTFRCHTRKDPETACHCLGQGEMTQPTFNHHIQGLQVPRSNASSILFVNSRNEWIQSNLWQQDNHKGKAAKSMESNRKSHKISKKIINHHNYHHLSQHWVCSPL